MYTGSLFPTCPVLGRPHPLENRRITAPAQIHSENFAFRRAITHRRGVGNGSISPVFLSENSSVSFGSSRAMGLAGFHQRPDEAPAQALTPGIPAEPSRP